jgi:hypothetical protein
VIWAEDRVRAGGSVSLVEAAIAGNFMLSLISGIELGTLGSRLQSITRRE